MEQFQIKGKKMIIRVPRELDHHTAEPIRTEADDLMIHRQIDQIEFDFRDTEFMDSSGIGVMMGRYQNIHVLGGTVCASHVNERIFRVLQLSGITKVIEIKKEINWSKGV